jgi:hypothetical protein
LTGRFTAALPSRIDAVANSRVVELWPTSTFTTKEHPMKKKNLILALALALAVAGTAFAQGSPVDPTATPRIDRREARQQKRIDQGVASGQLTPKEAAPLQAQQGRIEAAEARAKSDGV